VAITVICGYGGLATIGMDPKVETLDGVQTFLGTETIHKVIYPNLWIGPTEKYFIGMVTHMHAKHHLHHS
jgi:hypothetical protein